MNLQPYITEKSLDQAKKGVFTFLTTKSDNKITVSRLLKSLHNVTVINVTTQVNKSTARRFRGFKGREKQYKKMMVTVKKGQTIPGFEIVDQPKEKQKVKDKQ